MSNGFAQMLADKEQAHIDGPENVIGLPEGVIYGVHRFCEWPGTGARLNVFIYSNLRKIQKDTDELNVLASGLKTEAEKDPFNRKYKQLFDRYLSIQKSPAGPSDISVDIRKDVIADELHTNGRLVLVSNYIEDAREAISAYRTKDLAEKNFDQMKNRLGLCRMHRHNDTRAQNKLLISFIALVLFCHIDKVMRDSELYKRYTIKGLMNKMSQIRRGSFNGKKIVQDLDQQQKEIIRAFGIPAP